MAEAPQPGDANRPVPTPTAFPIFFRPENATGEVPPDAPVVRLQLEDGRSRQELPRWAIRLIWSLVVGLLGAVGTLVTAIFFVLRLMAQVEAIDSKIDAKVATKADDIRKEVFAESKGAKEELDLLQRAIEFERFFQEQICQGSYDTAIQDYLTTQTLLRPKDYPDSMKPAIYRGLVEAVMKSGKYGVIKEDELDKIDAILRKDLVSCGAATINRVAILYATMGKFEKARSVSTSVVTVFAVERNVRPAQDGAATIYATFLLIDLCQQTVDDSGIMAQNTWKALADLENKRLVRTSFIDASFDLPELAAVVSYISLRQGKSVRESLVKLRDMLKKKDFAKNQVEVTTPSGKRIETKLIEVDAEKIPKDLPKISLPEECDC